jgi:hypothetical protein
MGGGLVNEQAPFFSVNLPASVHGWQEMGLRWEAVCENICPRFLFRSQYQMKRQQAGNTGKEHDR